MILAGASSRIANASGERRKRATGDGRRMSVSRRARIGSVSFGYTCIEFPLGPVIGSAVCPSAAELSWIILYQLIDLISDLIQSRLGRVGFVIEPLQEIRPVSTRPDQGGQRVGAVVLAR